MAGEEEAGGLTKGERRVYLALAGLGASTANPVIRQTGMQKSAVYFCLDRLVAKGLASYIVRNNRRVFEAAPSAKLAEFIEERKRKLDEEKKEIEGVVRSLVASRKIEGRGARVFEGWGGLESAFDDMLASVGAGDEICVFSVSVPEVVLDRFRRFIGRFHEKRARKRVRARLLMNERMRPTIGSDRERQRHTAVRYIPEEYSTPAAINIYGNKVLINLISEKPTAFVVESKEVADSFRHYFEMLWSEETRVYRGLEGIRALLEEMLKYDEGLFIGGRGQVPIRMPEYFWESFAPRAERKGFRWRILGLPEIAETPLVKAKFVDIKLMPHTALGPIVIWIFGNKIANVVWKEEPVAFVLKSKEVADRYRDYFEVLWREETHIYRGIKGMRLLWEKALKENEALFIGGRGQVALHDPEYFFKDFGPRAEKKGFRWRILGLPEILKTPITKAKFVEIRLLPELAIGPTVTHICGDRVVNVIWAHAKEPIAFELESKELAKSYREYFEMLWRQAKAP